MSWSSGPAATGGRRLGPDGLAALCRIFGIPLPELARGGNLDDLAALGIRPT
jgi:hypothetical protein